MKNTIIVSINGLPIVDSKFTEEEAAIMLNNIGESFVSNIGDLQKRFGFTESYTKEKIGNGIWKYSFLVDNKYSYYIYVAGTSKLPKLPEHDYYAEMKMKDADDRIVKCIFCDTKEALDFYKMLTEKSIAEYAEYGEFLDHFEMTYSA